MEHNYYLIAENKCWVYWIILFCNLLVQKLVLIHFIFYLYRYKCDRLKLISGVPVVNVLSTSYTVNVGNSITLQCTVSANPTETSVTWERYVNNVATIIDLSNSRYSGSSVGSPSLVITNAAISDEGLYLCKASNSIGTGESKQTFLDVLGSKYRYLQ